MSDIHAYFLRKVVDDYKNYTEVQRNSVPNNEIQPTPEKELSPKSKRLQEHKMNRILSMDNFMKYSWSWTL